MKTQGRIALLAAVVGCLVVPAGLAQSTQPAQDQQNPQEQNQSQYSGVSHPPPDSSIQADEDAAPAPPPAAKPSAAIPMTAAPAAAPIVVPPFPAPSTSAPAAAPSGPLDNTDYGIVTVVPQRTSPNSDAALRTRNWNPNDDIVNYVPSGPNELAPGTNFTIRLSEELSTGSTQPGQTFRGTVTKNVYKDGQIVIPAGSAIRGRVVDVSQGHHIGPHATLRLRPDDIILPDGTAYHIHAEAVQSLAAGTRTDNEGGIVATHHYAKDAVEYGAGTGVGAVAGAEIAGPVGAGVGSLVGAGLVSAHMLIGHPEAASLPQGSMLVFSLTEPMTMTPTRN